MSSADVVDPITEDDLRSALDAIAAAEMEVDTEANAEDIDVGEEEIEEALPEVLPSGIRENHLYCRQGLSHNWAFNDTWFRPATTCEMWTRSAFYNSAGARLWISGWRYKGGGNPLAKYGNRWAYQNANVARAIAVWMTAVRDPTSGGWQEIHSWSSWVSCGQ